MRPVVCIAGPTASGKSDWAVRLAKKYDGEVINADSMQVYADLHIISARPTRQDMDGIPHHLFGHIDGNIRYSVGQWIRDVEPVIFNCLAREKMPILTGGTGLYFKALTDGLAQIPEPTDESVVQARAIFENDGVLALRAKAKALDPMATARVLGEDPQRLLRIVSVALGTDKPLSVWQADTHPLIPRGFWLGAILMPERETLYDRINRRFDMMVEQGGVAEVKLLLKRGLASDLPVMKAIGVRQLLTYLDGSMNIADALGLAKRDTRRFAKRQFTWFRGQAGGWVSVTNQTEKLELEQRIPQNID